MKTIGFQWKIWNTTWASMDTYLGGRPGRTCKVEVSGPAKHSNKIVQQVVSHVGSLKKWGTGAGAGACVKAWVGTGVGDGDGELC